MYRIYTHMVVQGYRVLNGASQVLQDRRTLLMTGNTRIPLGLVAMIIVVVCLDLEVLLMTINNTSRSYAPPSLTVMVDPSTTHDTC